MRGARGPGDPRLAFSILHFYFLHLSYNYPLKHVLHNKYKYNIDSIIQNAKMINKDPVKSWYAKNMDKNKDVWFVYIVKCYDGSLYTGITKDIEKRIIDHNNKKGSKYTRSRLPVLLVYHEKYESKSDASKRELLIKQLTKTQKLILINRGVE